MKNGFFLPRSISLAAVIVVLVGCASSPAVRYYTLTPAGHQEPSTSSREAAGHVWVSLETVEIPDYLDRPQIATRQGQNELKLAEFERWAGSLSDNITTVLAENIGTFLGSDRVAIHPGLRAGKNGFAVAVRILRLDCLPGNCVLLKAQWNILSGQDKKDVATRTQSFSESWSDKRYETMVAALSHLLEEVSREIARDIASGK